MRVIAYFTDSYRQDMKVLRLSLDAFGIQHHIQEIPDQGSWQANTAHKPVFVSEMLSRFNEPLVYIDVDAFVLGPLDYLASLSCSFAACQYESELLSGTLYLGNDDECAEMVTEWLATMAAYPETLPDGRPAWDQRTLKMVVDKRKAQNPDKYAVLPHAYTYIVGMTPLRYPECVQPVIVHTRGRLRHHPGV